MRSMSSDGAAWPALAGPRTGVCLCVTAAFAVAAAGCGQTADRTSATVDSTSATATSGPDSGHIIAGDTGRPARVGVTGTAVDTVADTVTTGTALNSTERPIQPPRGAGARPAPGPGPTTTP